MIMKLSKIVFFLLVSIALLAFCVSCNVDTEAAEASLVNVVLNIPPEKALNVSDAQSHGSLRYFYTAVPCFTGHAEGVAQTPVEITVSGGAACIGSFSRGSWDFTVFAVDDNNNTVLSGSTNAVLKAGFDNVVSISLVVNNKSGNGTLSLCFTGPYLGEGEYSLALLYRKAGEESFSKEQKAWSVNAEDPCVVYSGTLTLASGIYEVRFIYIKDGIQTGGETCVLNISGGFTSSVEGSVEDGLNVNNLVFVNDNKVESGKYKLDLNVDEGGEVVLAWNCTESVPTSLVWEIDGERTYGSTFSISPESGKAYLITCTAVTENGEEKAEISLEVSASEPEIIDLLFLRCPGLSSRTACVGYKDLQGNPVVFPYSFNGKVSADKTPSDYGLVPVIIDVTVKDNVRNLTYMEVDNEWERNTGWSNIDSFVASKVSAANTSLKYVVMKDNPLPSAFSYCTSLDTIVFAKGVENVTAKCCQGDKNLKTVYLCKGISKVAPAAFQKCPAIETVYIEEGSPLKVSDITFDEGVVPNIVFNCKSDLFR